MLRIFLADSLPGGRSLLGDKIAFCQRTISLHYNIFYLATRHVIKTIGIKKKTRE
jgi:hypothetical protein